MYLGEPIFEGFQQFEINVVQYTSTAEKGLEDRVIVLINFDA